MLRQQRSLAVVFAEMVLLTDLLIGLAWTFGSRVRTATPAYRTARTLLSWLPWHTDPIRSWGVLLTVLAGSTLLAMLLRLEHPTLIGFTLLLVYWLWWVALFLVPPVIDPTAGIAPLGWALLEVTGHFRPLATVGLVHRDHR